MKTNALFQSCLSEVTEDVKAEIDLSFAIVDRIDTLLKEKGMTQRELAEALGKNEAEISRWMRGTHNFTIRTLAKISNVLGTPIVSVSQ
jgi:plasmid maintenance system antidote protein VapI